ncbi:uncharacterized protein [Antedon mediterranea]|uniref:uncharacterized protein isoform X2 n=1 Tax=Antedon mediterranea TaxID=105859 RepID=UPI003AF6119E
MATDFDLDIVNVSTWYDKHNLFRQLKVLYKDLITVTNIDKARKTIDLLNELRKCGRLSSDNLALLYQTIKVTEQFGIINLLQHSFLEVQKVEITKFTLYRLQIVNFGNVLRQTDIEKIDALYNGSALKNYKDAWSLIMDLEQRQILCEEKLEEFIDNLKKIGLDSTVKLLNKDGSATEAVQLTLKRKLDTEGSEKSVAHCSDTPIMYARLPKCVKLDQVEEERIGEDVKSEAGKIERYLLQKQKKFCSQASRFTPAIMRIRYKVDISQMFTDMELLKQTESNQGSKATTIKEVVDVIKSTPGCKALIDGEGGIGKTTILRHLSYNWATGQSINVFEA